MLSNTTKQTELIAQDSNNRRQLAAWNNRLNVEKAKGNRGNIIVINKAHSEIAKLNKVIHEFRRRIKSKTKAQLSTILDKNPENFSKLAHAKRKLLKSQRDKFNPNREKLIIKWNTEVRRLEAAGKKIVEKSSKVIKKPRPKKAFKTQPEKIKQKDNFYKLAQEFLTNEKAIEDRNNDSPLLSGGGVSSLDEHDIKNATSRYAEFLNARDERFKREAQEIAEYQLNKPLIQSQKVNLDSETTNKDGFISFYDWYNALNAKEKKNFDTKEKTKLGSHFLTFVGGEYIYLTGKEREAHIAKRYATLDQ